MCIQSVLMAESLLDIESRRRDGLDIMAIADHMEYRRYEKRFIEFLTELSFPSVGPSAKTYINCPRSLKISGDCGQFLYKSAAGWKKINLKTLLLRM